MTPFNSTAPWLCIVGKVCVRVIVVVGKVSLYSYQCHQMLK